VTSTHINHLTPRVLDIDELYARMSGRGIEMIDAIHGPPRWNGPDILLRQTSFRALAEQRRFVETDGSVSTGSLRVRFGEVEARGIALTPAGRDRYDAMLGDVDAQVAAGRSRTDAATQVWQQHLPSTELGLLREGLGYFTFEPSGRPPAPGDPADLVASGVLRAMPIVYEDFVPRPESSSRTSPMPVASPHTRWALPVTQDGSRTSLAPRSPTRSRFTRRSSAHRSTPYFPYLCDRLPHLCVRLRTSCALLSLN